MVELFVMIYHNIDWWSYCNHNEMQPGCFLNMKTKKKMFGSDTLCGKFPDFTNYQCWVSSANFLLFDYGKPGNDFKPSAILELLANLFGLTHCPYLSFQLNPE